MKIQKDLDKNIESEENLGTIKITKKGIYLSLNQLRLLLEPMIGENFGSLNQLRLLMEFIIWERKNNRRKNHVYLRKIRN